MLFRSLITWSASDAAGNTGTATQMVTVVDTTPPSFALSMSTDTLWPVNHKMVEVGFVSKPQDIVDPNPIMQISVLSNQSVNGNGDRKSVVQGKSVDLGGRRIIKKKIIYRERFQSQFHFLLILVNLNVVEHPLLLLVQLFFTSLHYRLHLLLNILSLLSD